MFKLSQHLKALAMLTIVMIGIITRLMIGYGGYTNPLHRYHGATITAASSAPNSVAETRFHHFKQTRRIAMETLTHFTWHLDVPTAPSVRLAVSLITLRDDCMQARAISPHLRPPSLA